MPVARAAILICVCGQTVRTGAMMTITGNLTSDGSAAGGSAALFPFED
jgi:hypothetical protein